MAYSVMIPICDGEGSSAKPLVVSGTTPIQQPTSTPTPGVTNPRSRPAVLRIRFGSFLLVMTFASLPGNAVPRPYGTANPEPADSKLI
jgi:hypothetical protein